MNTAMNTTSDDEVLSALADDALSHDEVARMVARLRDEPLGIRHRAARQLERYALLGDLMRAEADSPLFAAVAARHAARDVVGLVMQQIATQTPQAEASKLAPPIPRKPGLFSAWLGGWRAPVVSMALAASVAGVMLVVMQDVGLKQDIPLLNAQSAPSVPSIQATATEDLTESVPSASSLAELEAAADALPDAYMLQHLTHADGGSMRTLSSNIRIASYERP